MIETAAAIAVTLVAAAGLACLAMAHVEHRREQRRHQVATAALNPDAPCLPRRRRERPIDQWMRDRLPITAEQRDDEIDYLDALWRESAGGVR